MLRLSSWVSAECDTCGAPHTDDYEGDYFADEQAATASAEEAGWQVTAGGWLLCCTCRVVRECEIYGHVWPDQWSPRPVLDDSQPGGIGRAEIRYCRRCAERETRPVTPGGGQR